MIKTENIGLKNGILFGVACIGLGLLLYTIDKKLFLDPVLRLGLSLILPIIFMRKAGLDQKKELGGYANFTEVLQPIYLCLIIGTLAFSIFQFIVMSMDFELLEIQREITLESLKSLKSLSKFPEESLAQFEEITAEDLKPNLKSLMLSLAKNFILGFIIAAIIAAIVKKEKLTVE